MLVKSWSTNIGPRYQLLTKLYLGHRLRVCFVDKGSTYGETLLSKIVQVIQESLFLFEAYTGCSEDVCCCYRSFQVPNTCKVNKLRNVLGWPDSPQVSAALLLVTQGQYPAILPMVWYQQPQFARAATRPSGFDTPDALWCSWAIKMSSKATTNKLHHRLPHHLSSFVSCRPQEAAISITAENYHYL